MRRIINIIDWKLKRDKVDQPSEGITHALWETNDESFGFYFYYINEYGLMRNFGKLQILKDKNNPQILYDSKNVFFDYNPYDTSFIEYDWTDEGFLVLRQLLERGFKLPVIIINLNNMTFVSFDKFHVQLKLKDNILTTIETFYNKEKQTKEKVIETFNFETIEWTSLNELI